MTVLFRLAAAAAVLALSSACSKTEEPKKQAATPPATQPPAAPQPAKSLAEADFEVGGVKVALLELKRSSTGITARWQYRNETDSEVKATLGGTVGGDNQRLPRNAYLLDAATKTKYGVEKDTDGKLLAAQHGEFVHGVRLKPRQIVNTWAKFPALPETTKRVTVIIAGAPPFEDMPVE
jgi:hypothetical protein